MDTSDANLSNSTFEKDLLKYPDEVQAAINEIFPSDDPLDAPDFDPVDYINEMFPTEQSLVNLDDVLSDYKCKIHVIDEDMRRIVRGQTNVGEDAAASLEEAQVCNSSVFISDIFRGKLKMHTPYFVHSSSFTIEPLFV